MFALGRRVEAPFVRGLVLSMYTEQGRWPGSSECSWNSGNRNGNYIYYYYYYSLYYYIIQLLILKFLMFYLINVCFQPPSPPPLPPMPAAPATLEIARCTPRLSKTGLHKLDADCCSVDCMGKIVGNKRTLPRNQMSDPTAEAKRPFRPPPTCRDDPRVCVPPGCKI